MVRGVGVAAAVLWACARAAGAGEAWRTVSTPDGERIALEVVPDDLGDGRPRALVVGLHPGLSTASNFRSSAGWDAVAASAGVALLYPQVGATPEQGGVWNQYTSDGSGRDDLGYLLAAIDQAVERLGVDPRNVFMTGSARGR